MRGFYLYFLLNMILGNPLGALLIIFIIYLVLDKAFIRLLPNFGAIFRRNNRIAALKNLLYINQSNASAAKELGILYFEKKQFTKCIEILKIALKRIEESSELYSYLGMAMMEIGEAEEASVYLNKAVEIDKKVSYGLPYVYLLGYEISKNSVDVQKVTSLELNVENFSNVENLYKMSKKYKSVGNMTKCAEMCRLALKEYTYCPKNLKKLHRKWAVLAKISLIANMNK